jgi:4-hydroxy-3-polyprenylbenzoate decarboxylase
MSFRSLGEFLEQLTERGELLRVAAAVEGALEIAEITDRIAQKGGPALLFDQVQGHRLPIVTNLLGSHARLAKGLGLNSLDELSARMAEMGKAPAAEGWLSALKKVPQLAQSSAAATRSVKTGACQQVVKLGSDVNLADLPAIQVRPLDARRSLPGVTVLTRDPDTSELHLGTHSVEILDKGSVSVRWLWPEPAARDARRAKERREPLAVALWLGGDFAAGFLAGAPLPPGIDPLSLAAALRGKPLDVVRGRAIDLDVPADAEIVLEGVIDPAEPDVDLGPLADPCGQYLPSGRGQRVKIAALTHRANPACPLRMTDAEDAVRRKGHERLILPWLKTALPELVELSLPACGRGRFAFAAIRKTYPQQARQAAAGLWGLAPLKSIKLLVLVDADVDVHQADEVWRRAATHAHPGRDTWFHEGPADPHDQAAPVPLTGGAMAIDATAKLPGEHPAVWPAEAAMSDEIRERVTARWREYGLEKRGG